MLLLLQSYITYAQFPRAGGEVITPAPVLVEDTDDELLLAWFTYMQRYYEKEPA
jgi:hypothetical protein